MKVSVSEDCQHFLMGYSQLEEKDTVMDWLTSNFDIERIVFGNYEPVVGFKTKIKKGFDVVLAILDQNEFGVIYIQEQGKVTPA